MSSHRAPTNFFGGIFCYTDLYRQILQVQHAFIAKTFYIVLIQFTYIYLYSKKTIRTCLCHASTFSHDARGEVDYGRPSCRNISPHITANFLVWTIE